MRPRASVLRDNYQLLEVSDAEGAHLRARAVEPERTPWGVVQLAVDASGHRHVLIPVPDGLRLRTDRRSAGIHVGPEVLIDGGQRRVFLDLACLMPHLYDVFLRIALEIIDRINDRDATPDACAIEVLERWRSLLARGRRPGPTLEQLTGLFGELTHLEAMAAHEPSTAVARWTGPVKGVWDFTGPGRAIEVKTSRARAGWRAEIHGIQQLDPGAEISLVLSLLRVEVVETGESGRSVRDQVDALLDAGVDAIGLYDRLDRMGLSTGHFEAAGDTRFRILDRRAWPVDEGFPRLVAASFVGGAQPVGVASIDYALDLTAHAAPPLSATELAAHEAGLVGAEE